MITRRGTKHLTEMMDNSALWYMVLPIELASLWIHSKLIGVDKIPNQLLVVLVVLFFFHVQNEIIYHLIGSKS